MTSLVLEPALTSEAILNSGVKKMRLPIWKMILLGNLTGIHLSLGAQGAVSCMATTGYPIPTPTKWFGGVVFSTGLVMVVMSGAELFTGNVLLLVAVLAKRVVWYEMLKHWFIVYLSNFFGVIMFAATIYGGGINGYHNHPDSAGSLLCHIAEAKADLTAWEMFLRGIGANFLVCVAVLLAVSSKTTEGKILGIILPIALFFVIGFEHSIANMYFFTTATYLNCPVKNHGYYWLNLLLVTLGNILGGAVLAFTLWAGNVQETAEAPAAPMGPSSPQEPHQGVDSTNGSNGTQLLPVFDQISPTMAKEQRQTARY